MRKSCLLLLALSCLFMLAGCAGASTTGASSASNPTPTTAPAPTPTPTIACPQLPSAQPGPAPTAPLSLYAAPSNTLLAVLNTSDGKPRWNEQLAPAGGLVDSAVVAQNVVYAAVQQQTQEGYLVALNAADGALRWCVRQNNQLIPQAGEGPPELAADQSALYVGGGLSGSLAAFDVSDGKIRWVAQAKGGILALVVAAGQVYVSSEDTTGDAFAAFNASTGKRAWDFQTGNGVFTQPVVANGVVYVAEGKPNFPGFLYALNASDGNEVWHVQEQAGSGFGTPSVLNGSVYVAGSQGVYAFNASTSALRWKVQQAIATMGLVIDTNNLYIASVNGSTGQTTISALKLSDGSQLWQTQPTIAALASGVSLAPASSSTGLTVFAAANGMVYITTNTSIGALNASNGKQVWSATGAALAVG